jgi:hypothetical protein
MIRTLAKQILSCVVSCLLIVAAVPLEMGAQQTPPAGSTGYSGQGAPLSPQELQQLVAPIALYPDSLVAQILGGATFPDQIVNANQFLKDNPSLTGQTLMYAVDAQSWEPAVKALTQFPSVLANMASNLSWTSALGEAYHNQTSDVMSAVQVLRAQAYAAGNLKSGSQITVVQQSPQVIVIQPTNPQVVYVPQYNPAVVYGVPYTTPGYSTAAVVATGMLAFGAGIAVGAAMSGGCCGWSYSSWNCGWHGGAVVYGGSAYYGNNAWHGGYYGSSASAYGPYGSAHAGTAYNPSTGTYARGGYTTTPYGANGAAQAYNPNTGAYGATHQESNAYGNAGQSVYSKNGQTTYTQHETTAQGSVGTMQSTNGAKAAAGTNANGNYAAGESANGTKYAEQNGNVYKNSGSGWQQTQGSSNSHSNSGYSSESNYSHSGSSYSGGSSADSKGWGQQDKSGGSSMSGNGWQSREDSSRGWSSRGGGGGWGGRR